MISNDYGINMSFCFNDFHLGSRNPNISAKFDCVESTSSTTHILCLPFSGGQGAPHLSISHVVPFLVRQ